MLKVENMSLDLRAEVWVRASGLGVISIYLRQECYSPRRLCRGKGAQHQHFRGKH